MTNPEVVFAKFVEANPASDVEALNRQRPDVDEALAAIDDTVVVAGRPNMTRVKPSGWWVAAATFLIVVGLGTALGILRTPTGDQVSNPAEVLRMEAVASAEQWIAAINVGDISAVMALSSADTSSIADQRVHEWVAGLAAEGMPVQLVGCEATTETQQRVAVECDVRLTDEVAVELGVSELVAPFHYADGLLAWQPYTGGDISQVNTAYSTYLRLFHSSEYDRVCSPVAYEPGSIVADSGLALTEACADLAAPLAGDVVQWIRDGRPTP